MTHIIVALALLASPVIALSEPERVEAFSPEEKKAALEALNTIAKTFGEKPAEQPQGKTVADVADKALDISMKYIGQAASVVEKAAPRVWEVMVRQQYAKAIGNIIQPILWFLTFITASIVMRIFWKQPMRVDRDTKTMVEDTTVDEHGFRVGVTLIIPGILCLIAGGFVGAALADTAMYLINPEYYAIKDLVQILRGGM